MQENRAQVERLAGIADLPASFAYRRARLRDDFGPGVNPFLCKGPGLSFSSFDVLLPYLLPIEKNCVAECIIFLG